MDKIGNNIAEFNKLSAGMKEEAKRYSGEESKRSDKEKVKAREREIALEKERQKTQLLLLKKMQQGFKNKRIIQANSEFQQMMKLLQQEGIPNCPVTGVEKLQKMASFEDLNISGSLGKVRFIQVASELENNFMIAAIEGVVYRYSLTSREEEFSFKTVINVFRYLIGS